MGKKIEIKKIVDAKACQVTYTKRKKSLIKKAREISIACGIDLAFISFSPTKRGRSTKFCSVERIEDLIQRYLNLSPEKKFHEVNNGKVHCEANFCKQHVHYNCQRSEKLKQLDHVVVGDDDKLHDLKNQIRDIERRITSTSLETEVLEDRLRFYEPNPKDDLSSSDIILLERNLKQALQQVQNKKNEFIKSPSRKYRMRNQKKDKAKLDDHLTKKRPTKNPISGSLQMQHDHLISKPFSSSSFPEFSFQELLAHVRGVAAQGKFQFPPTYSSSVQHQPIMGNQISSLGFPNQQFNFSSVGLEAPMQGFHQSHPTQTQGHNWTNVNNQNIVPSTSHFQANPNEVDFTYANGTFNTILNSDHFHINFDQPINCERVPNTIASVNIDSNNNNSEHFDFTKAVTAGSSNNGSVVDNNNNNGSIENSGSNANPIAQIPPTLDNAYIQNVMSPTFQFEANFDEANFTDAAFSTIFSDTNHPLNPERAFSSVDNEPIFSTNNNNENGNIENNGGSSAALSTQVNLLPNSNEAEKGNKENNWLLDSDDLTWAEDLNWEELRILLAEF